VNLKSTVSAFTVLSVFAWGQPVLHSQVKAEMHNVMYHFTGPIAVHIVQLEGELEATESKSAVVFDDANSFAIAIQSAKITITTDALSSVMNQYALSAPDAPIKDVRVVSRGNKLKIQGKLHSKGDVPFEAEGTLSVTPDGEIRVHTEKLKAGHLPIKGLMDLLGKTLANTIDTRKVRGLRADKDDLLLSPEELFPPPHIKGKLRSIAVVGNEIVQEYGTPSPSWMKISGNYMAYRSGRLRFGKLTMNDADLVLIDMDAQDPMDFYLGRYKQQLEPGYSKITASFGLRTYCKDYNKLHATGSTR
jgi:hypothetical protein